MAGGIKFKVTLILLFTGFGFVLLTFTGCLERDNPWDPLNQTGTQIDTLSDSDKISIQEEFILELDDEREGSALIKTAADSLYALFLVQSSERDSVQSLNDSLISFNNKISENNQTLDTLNNLSCYTLKSQLQFLLFVSPILLSADFNQLTNDWNALGVNVLDKIDSARSEYTDTTVLVQTRDSIAMWFSDYSDTLVLYKTEVDSANSDISTANDSLSELNNSVSEDNDIVVNFNQAVERSPQFCNIRLSDPVAIVQSVNNLRAGDSLFLDSATINIELTIKNSGVTDTPIVIMGDTAGNTVLTSQISEPVFIDNVQNFEIHNVTFTGGTRSGLKLVNSSGSVKLVNCSFTENAFRGLEIIDTELELVNCRFIDNGAEGIYISSKEGADENISFTNILVARNGGSGISGLTVEGSISFATIVFNQDHGIYLDVPQTPLTVSHSIIAYNTGYGINREQVTGADGELSLDSVNIFMNTGGSILSLPPYDTLSFLSGDPLFVDSIYYRSDSLSGFDNLGYRPSNQ